MFTWKPHASLRFHFGQNDRYRIHTILSFISPQFMWTQVKIWLRFSTEIKSHGSLSSFRLSCECTPNRIKTAINKLIFQNVPKNLNFWYCTFDKAGFSLSKKIVLFTQWKSFKNDEKWKAFSIRNKFKFFIWFFGHVQKATWLER